MFKKIGILAITIALLAAKPAVPFKALDGSALSLDEVTSELTVINFWAVWCKPCVQEMPELNQVYKKFQDKPVNFLAVSISREKNLIENFLRKTPVDFKVVIDDTEALANYFRVSAMPTTILIDKDHNILFKYQGFSKKELSKLENLIEQKLNIKNQQN